MPLKPGDKAPDFTLLDQRGEPLSLGQSVKQRKAWHLVYFYPEADTPSSHCAGTPVTSDQRCTTSNRFRG